MTTRPRNTEGERLDPAAAFEIIGNETRLEILRILFEEKFSGPVAFAELRKRAGMSDSGQFNYHLKKLDGPFVRKTDEGYQIRLAGIYVILTILQGSFTEHPQIPPFETGGACIECGEPLLAEYVEEMVYVRCPSCETMHTMGMFPPSAVLGRTDEELLVAFDRWQRHDFDLAVGGVCSMCGGAKAATLVRDAADVAMTLPGCKQETGPGNFPEFGLGILYPCTQCDVWEFGSPGKHVLDHPDVVAFHEDHGVDLEALPYWELDWVVGNERTTVVAEDPLRVEVTIPLDDEQLRVTLDESFAVLAVERTRIAS